MKKLLILLLSALLLTACGSEEKNSITKEEYEKLEVGMTVDEVSKVVGGLPSKFEYDENEKYQSIHYKGEDGIEESSTAFIDFADGVLESKREIGLLTEKEESTETEEKPKDEPEEEASSWDDLKEQDKIIGKSDKDFSGVTKSKPNDVRNDNTGKWRILKISENIDIEEYALSYADMYMKDDEVHFIVNFNYHTTTVINKMNGLLYVDIKEYEKREEHDAKDLGNGMLLKSYVIFPDGDIQELDEL